MAAEEHLVPGHVVAFPGAVLHHDRLTRCICTAVDFALLPSAQLPAVVVLPKPVADTLTVLLLGYAFDKWVAQPCSLWIQANGGRPSNHRGAGRGMGPAVSPIGPACLCGWRRFSFWGCLVRVAFHLRNPGRTCPR